MEIFKITLSGFALILSALATCAAFYKDYDQAAFSIGLACFFLLHRLLANEK